MRIAPPDKESGQLNSDQAGQTTAAGGLSQTSYDDDLLTH